ncbi:MAG: phosphoribosylanthranilate isomerase [Alphaproteobacteria bacterium]|nr:phosphoribosylanthranilate isomerase [Alphaproteobacteria bacterium]
MTIIVKICGLTSPEGLEAALSCGADMVGFVVFAQSPRHVSLKLASELGRQAAGRGRKVLLTVDAEDAMLGAAIAALDPDILQLHGHETPERVSFIRSRFGLPVMKAIGIAGEADFSAIAAFDAAADYLLFDARPQEGQRRPGGNGKSFDWRLLNGIKTKKPWLLAGGLDTANVANALAQTQAPGVDVSSGVERAPGIKDKDKIAAFIMAARGGALPLAKAAVNG